MVIDGHDVTNAIRTPEIDRAAAATARLPTVRAALVERQRKEGECGGIVMEGRDIGSVVFPNADVKIYLDASPEERARRRAADPAHGVSRAAAAVDVATEMAARDQSDRTRSTSPLRIPKDAIELDTTGLSIEDDRQAGAGHRESSPYRPGVMAGSGLPSHVKRYVFPRLTFATSAGLKHARQVPPACRTLG